MERSTNTRRILQLNPNYPLAQYHLGQAFERKCKVEQAKAAYERFLQNWKSADADIPEIVEAKKQFATGLAAIDSEALNGWSQAGRAVAKQSLTSLGKPEVTVDGHQLPRSTGSISALIAETTAVIRTSAPSSD